MPYFVVQTISTTTTCSSNMPKTTLGVISDTHGLLRPEAMEILRGAEMILHAGDVGVPGILDELRAIAPVRVVRGNVDYGDWADAIPETEVISVGGRTIYMLHIVDQLGLSPEAAGFDAVIFGHSHRPTIERRRDVLFFNPGSAGPRRFDLPITVGKLHISEAGLEPEIIQIG